MGYPKKQTVYHWIHDGNEIVTSCNPLKLINHSLHPRNLSAALKMESIQRCFELGESVLSVSEDIGYSRVSICTWHKKYLQEGAAARMDTKDIKRVQLNKGIASSIEDVNDLKK